MSKNRLILLPIAAVLILMVGVASGEWFLHVHLQALDKECVENLRCIDAAKMQWALENVATSKVDGRWVTVFDAAYSNAVPTEKDIVNYNSRNQNPMPRCPRGGTNVVGRVADPPTCSFPGRGLP